MNPESKNMQQEKEGCYCTVSAIRMPEDPCVPVKSGKASLDRSTSLQLCRTNAKNCRSISRTNPGN
jgi:hypothetical protein